MKYREIRIEENKWSSLYDLEESVPFSFDYNSNLGVILKGITLGKFDESMSIPVKAVRHDFMEEDGYRVETSSVIPYGSEPYIARKFEYLGNIIKVTSDVRVKAGINGNLFSIDDLELKGNYKSFAVLGQKLAGKLTWKKISGKDSVLYESEDLFAVLLFESEDGSRIEIGTGFDIWRWNIAERLQDVSGKLSVSLQDGKVIVKRAVMCSENEFEIPKRDYRFTWYLAWCGTEDTKKDYKIEENNIFSVNDFEYQDSGKVFKEGKCEEFICMNSKYGRNMLKKWLRSIVNKKEGVVLSLKDLFPHICDNSSHLERSKGGAMPHWDLLDIVDFHFWANRQLRRKVSYLSIFTEKDKIFSQLPSFMGMK